MKIYLVIILFLSSFSAAEKKIESYEVKIIDEFKINKLLPGKITPKRQSILGFEISGKLKKVVVDIGDEVNAGDLLAELKILKLWLTITKQKQNFRCSKKSLKDLYL